MKIITHRGITAENAHIFSESSREAFIFFLKQGYGIEFDVQLTKENIPVISHDNSLTRLMGDTRVELGPIVDMTEEEFLATPLKNGHTVSLQSLIEDIGKYGHPNAIHAFHLKYHLQNSNTLDILLPYLEELTKNCTIIIFDAIPQSAQFLRRHIPDADIAASVAHQYDILRYGYSTGNTLISDDLLITKRSNYNWAWLDEWDTRDENGNSKKFYTQEVFQELRKHDFKIALVSPELHATSPALLGGERHLDATDTTNLFARIEEIVSLVPDVICTDWPNKTLSLCQNHE